LSDRARVDSFIDSKLKKLFEATKPLHEKTIGEATEMGMRTILTGLHQKQLIDMEIKRMDLELLELTQKQTALKTISERLNNISNMESESRKDLDDTEKHRLNSLSTLLKTNWEDWTSMNKAHAIKVGKFKSRDELEEWVRNH